MARKIRYTNPECIRLITIRTLQSRLFLTPSSHKVVQEQGGLIARYQEMYGVKIYAYILLGNHYHLLISGTKANIWQFEQSLNRELSRRTNFRLNRSGTLWSRRYSELICPTAEDALEALIYIATNAVHHRLVENPEQWPGLHCYEQLLDENPRRYPYVNWSAYNRAKKSRPAKEVFVKDFTTYHNLSLSPIPELEKMTQPERASFIKQSILSRVEDITSDTKSALGALAVQLQEPTKTPKNIKQSIEPVCYSKNPATIRDFKEWFTEWMAKYKEISKKFRSGELTVNFPEFSIPPPLLYIASG